MNSYISPAPFHKVEMLSSQVSFECLYALGTYANLRLKRLANRNAETMLEHIDEINELVNIIAASDAVFENEFHSVMVSAKTLTEVLKSKILSDENRNVHVIQELLNLIRSCR